MAESFPAFSDCDISAAIDRACTEAGIWELKQHQKNVVISFVKGVEIFGSLPTGYRKSLIYALLPSLFDCLRQKHGAIGRSIVVCVTPLSTLMIDQKARLSRVVDVEFVGQEQEDPEAIDRVIREQHQLVFISPEKLIRDEEFRMLLLTDVYKENLLHLADTENKRTSYSRCARTLTSRTIEAVASSINGPVNVMNNKIHCYS